MVLSDILSSSHFRNEFKELIIEYLTECQLDKYIGIVINIQWLLTVY